LTNLGYCKDRAEADAEDEEKQEHAVKCHVTPRIEHAQQDERGCANSSTEYGQNGKHLLAATEMWVEAAGVTEPSLQNQTDEETHASY